jgi:hypothetical protein
MSDAIISPISFSLVEENDRLNFLPKYLGVRLMMSGEHFIFNWMNKLSDNYQGGYWNFYDLSNGGFFMAPKSDSQFSIFVQGNGFDGIVSPDSAGIIATLYALNTLMFRVKDRDDYERIVNLYYLLRDFSSEHPESGKIFSAID